MGKPSSTILTIIYNYYNNNILKSVTSIFSGDPYIFNSNPLGFSPAVPSGSCSLGLPRCLATHPLDERSVSWFGGESPATWPCWLYKYTAHGMYIYITIHRCTIYRYKSIYVKYGNGRNDLVSFCLEKRFRATCSSTDDPSSSCWSDFLQVVTWLLHLPKLSSFTNHQ